ncbi:MAG: elongation factor P, partial [Pseudomonadota bacterium]
IQPGKGGAFIQVEMRDVAGGVKSNERWRTQDTVEKLSVDSREYAYLFADGDMLTFMDSENYEQTTLPRDLLGGAAAFLQENMQVSVDLIEGKPAAVHLPQTVVLEVTEADPVVKGQTAASSYKPAMLSNGVRTMVPPFIGAGTRIVVNTEDGSYVERAKS